MDHSRNYNRRDFLRTALQAGAGLSAASLLGCGGGAGGSAATGGGGGGGGDNVIDDPGYKALVCVFLFGGNDAYNLLVPTTASKYGSYAAARLNLAIGRDQLLPLNGTAADGAAYGLHPSCPELQGLFNGGSAAVLANVGSLTAPSTHADYAAGRVPPRLFSHNDQQDQWQSSRPEILDVTGWAGRTADLITDANLNADLPVNMSLFGSNLLQRGGSTSFFSFSAGGAQQLAGLPADSALRGAFDQLRALPRSHAFESTFAGTLDRGIRLNADLDSALAAAPELATAFPANNYLAAQLKMVARLIGVRETLGMKRQIFFTGLGGFDTHDAQLTDQPVLLQRVSQALAAFHAATVELGIADRVTAFTASDFGRSLTVNGKGTDHGWSSHHLVVGGAVNGGQIYGTPPSLVAGGSDDTVGGRFIPSTAVDQYAATLVKWFGITDANLTTVLPNLGRFATRDLGFLR